MHPGLFIGREIDGYRIQKIIGRGGMGIVFRAVDVMLDRRVAIKLVDPAYVDEKSFMRRLSREARALARLQSPHIVTIHALRRTEIGLFIVMEYVDGQTLREWASGQPVPWTDLRPVLQQTLTALGHAHKLGVVHRDIKPANIMITMSGRVKIMDFGIAKVLTEETATATQGITGTLYYMSPEQVERSENVDGRSDLYSLGMTAYRLLTAELPFEEGLGIMSLFRAIVEEEPPPIRSLNADVPPAAAAIIKKALQKDRNLRFQNASEMLKALDEEAGVREAPTAIEVGAGGARVAKESGSRRRWGRWTLAAIVLLAVVGGVVAGGISLVSDGADTPIAAAMSPLERDAKSGEAESDGDPVDSVEDSSEEDADTAPTGSGADTPRSGPGADGQTLPGGEPGRSAVALESADSTEAAAADEATVGDESPEEAVTPTGIALIESTPAGARVYIDGRDSGRRTPARITLPVGQYRVSLYRDGYAPSDSPVRVVEGQVKVVNPTLEPAYGTLTVRVEPYGDVYVDGELRERDVDFPRSIDLSTGVHTLKVRHPELESYEQRVRIFQGEETIVIINLRAE